MSSLLQHRRAGVLLHPTSLPSGKLDADVERWLDFMQDAGLSVWQVLPLVIPDHTGSPYQSCSAFAADPGLLGDVVPEAGGLDARAAFYWRQRDWLPDYARFVVLKQLFPGQAWNDWPPHYRDRDAEAMADFDARYAEQIDGVMHEQFLLEQRWQEIRGHAAQRNILLFGDVPIFVAFDSADVWANRDQFLLDETGQPEFVAGVPPDYFSETGQRWGNPHYDWEAMRHSGFGWWQARLQRQLDWFDIIRIDHFRGLEACWMIRADCATAIDGFWQKVPGADLLSTLRQSFDDLPIVAEDLGIITPEVTELRRRFELPGMAVVQFAFDAFEDNPHKPVNIQADQVAYSGTHDNNTTRGWFDSLDPDTRQFVLETLGAQAQDDIVQLMMRRVLETRANLAILPLQDILGLGEEARMNRPGLTEGNWAWRFDWSQISAEHARAVRALVTETGRLYEG